MEHGEEGQGIITRGHGIQSRYADIHPEGKLYKDTGKTNCQELYEESGEQILHACLQYRVCEGLTVGDVMFWDPGNFKLILKVLGNLLKKIVTTGPVF